MDAVKSHLRRIFTSGELQGLGDGMLGDSGDVL